MTRFVSVGVPVAAALGLHAVLLLWPMVAPPKYTPPTVAVTLVSSAPATVVASQASAPVRRAATADQPVPPTAEPVTQPPISTPAPGSTSPAPDSGEPAVAPAQNPVTTPEANPAMTSDPADQAGPTASGPATTAAAVPAEAGGDISAAEAWSATVRSRVDAKKSYPYAARAQGLQGRVTVAFVIGAGGAVSAPRVTVSSGYASLDRAALMAVQAAAPFPLAPASWGQGPWPFTVTLVFTLR